MKTNQKAELALCVAGLGVSGYLSLVHLTEGQITLVCSTSGAINCERVTTSAQSMVGPLPVAFLGVGWFLVMLGLVMSSTNASWSWASLAWAFGGVAFVLYLIYAELFLIGAICLWCTVVHLLVVALFLMNLATWATVLDEAAVATDRPRHDSRCRAR